MMMMVMARDDDHLLVLLPVPQQQHCGVFTKDLEVDEK
jgi:hypothetical protein